MSNKSEIIDFPSLDIEKKIQVCNQCQRILSQDFQDSEYTLTKGNFEKGIEFYRKLIDNFNGRVFRCQDAIIFFKRNEVQNPHDAQNEFLRMYREPHIDNGNCVFVDFMAAKISKYNEQELKDFFFANPQIEYVMASRRGEIYFKGIKSLRVIAERMGSVEKFISSLAS